jgi:hypothetical protein
MCIAVIALSKLSCQRLIRNYRISYARNVVANRQSVISATAVILLSVMRLMRLAVVKLSALALCS